MPPLSADCRAGVLPLGCCTLTGGLSLSSCGEYDFHCRAPSASFPSRGSLSDLGLAMQWLAPGKAAMISVQRIDNWTVTTRQWRLTNDLESLVMDVSFSLWFLLVTDRMPCGRCFATLFRGNSLQFNARRRQVGQTFQ